MSGSDLAVVGGGHTGLAIAIAAASGGVRVSVIERVPPAALTAAPFDGRATAIACGSRRLLETIGVWEHMAGRAEPILDIRVGEPGSLFAVHYDHEEVGDEPLGHIVENRVIREALLTRAREMDLIALIAPAELADVVREDAGARLTLADGRVIETPLVVAADGRNSGLRHSAGIEVTRWDYRQIGIVCTLAHELPHDGLAFERFFPDGPFAILPMQGNHSSIVWALDESLAREMIGLDDDEFTEEVAERLGDSLGHVELAGPRWHYPLSLVWAQRYTDLRLALVGDAARAIHPISGQGWNLALRDVATLAEIVVDHHRLGLDPGTEAALASFARWRRFDSLALIAITDGLTRLFSNDILPVSMARNVGLGLVERLPPLKRFFMRHAMGQVGDLPRTMRGAAL